MSDSLQPHRLQPTRLLSPWDFQARILESVAISSSREAPYKQIYICVYIYILNHFVYTWNWHNIVNQLYFNKKGKKNEYKLDLNEH